MHAARGKPWRGFCFFGGANPDAGLGAEYVVQVFDVRR